MLRGQSYFKCDHIKGVEYMKKYYDPENTPLKFHMLFTYVLIPLGIVINAVLVLSAVSKVSAWSLSNPDVVEIGVNVFNIAYFVVLFVGLGKMKTYGWIMLIVYTFMSVLLSLSNMALFWTTYPEMVGAEIPSLMVMALSSLYYVKRRALFFKGPIKQSTMTIQPIGAVNTNNHNEIDPIVESIENKEAEEVKKRDEIFNQIIQPKRSFKLPLKIFNGVMIAALVLVGIFAIMSQKAAADSRSEVAKLMGEIQAKDTKIVQLDYLVEGQKKDIITLQSKITSLQNEQDPFATVTAYSKAEFMDNYVVIVPDDGKKMYHKYGCSKLSLSYFWVYNIEAAKDQGYKPCSYCNP